MTTVKQPFYGEEKTKNKRIQLNIKTIKPKRETSNRTSFRFFCFPKQPKSDAAKTTKNDN